MEEECLKMGYILPVPMLQSQYYSNYDRLAETKQDPFHIQPVRKTFNFLLKKEIKTPEQVYQKSVRTDGQNKASNGNSMESFKQISSQKETTRRYINVYI
jgi:hypothetical protein